MLLVKVAILTLLHPQQVSVNHTVVSRHGEQVESGGHLQDDFRFSGEFQLAVGPAFRRRYRGDLRIISKNNELQIRLTAREEDLVAAIVSAESPPGAPPSALAAQAILARSWLRAAKGRHRDFDFCDTTHCQHFKDVSPHGVVAALATRGLILTWQGKPFAPAYSASCGGRTQTASAIEWDPEGGYPYFAVECPICKREEPPWVRVFNPDDAALLREHPHAESTRLAIGRRSGWDALPGNNYELIESPPKVETRGRGRGHGLGYCQKGGAGMARQGTALGAILRHYFPGTDIISSR